MEFSNQGTHQNLIKKFAYDKRKSLVWLNGRIIESYGKKMALAALHIPCNYNRSLPGTLFCPGQKIWIAGLKDRSALK